MARVEIITTQKIISPYKAVIGDILKRHGYTQKQLEYAESHYPSSQPIPGSKMIHVIIVFCKLMDNQHEFEKMMERRAFIH